MRKIVLGIGNTLNRDEGLGVTALEALRQESESPEVEFLDGGTLGLNLLPVVEEASHLLILDAVDASAEPGTVVELDRDEIPLFSGVKMSEHQITFQEVLGLAKIRGKFPENIHLIGIQPSDMEIGLGISPPVASAMTGLLERAREVLRSWEDMK